METDSSARKLGMVPVRYKCTTHTGNEIEVEKSKSGLRPGLRRGKRPKGQTTFGIQCMHTLNTRKFEADEWEGKNRAD